MKRAFGAVLIVSTVACGGSPTQPSQAPFQDIPLTGVWTGLLRVASCQSGQYPCDPVLGVISSFVLRIANAGGGYRALLELPDSSELRLRDVDLAGGRQADGSVLFTAVQSGPGPTSDARVIVSVDSANGLKGSVEYTTQSYHQYHLTSLVVSASKKSLDASPARLFDATWNGSAIEI